MADQTMIGTMGTQAPTASLEKAGFGKRLLAILIDSVLIWAVSGMVGSLMGQDVFSSQDGTISFEMTGLAALVLMLGPIVYYTLMEGGRSGQTLGKKLLGIKVIREGSGEPLGYGKAFVRWLGRIPSSFVFALGYLWMIWDDEKQTWHDKIADTYVVKAR